MKYLRRFNEELTSSVYRRASRKLKKLGHDQRSKDLQDWSIKVENKEKLYKWKENIKDFSKFGTFKLKITNPDNNKQLIEDFYLILDLNTDLVEENFTGEKGSIGISVGIIPVNKDVLEKCNEIFPEPEFDNGFYFGLFISIDFDIIDSEMVFKKIILDDYDSSLTGNVKLADRSSAGKFKRLLEQMFSNPNLNYPSGYTIFEYFYDLVNLKIGAELGFSSGYGFSPELVAEFIDKVSPNEF